MDVFMHYININNYTVVEDINDNSKLLYRANKTYLLSDLGTYWLSYDIIMIV